MIKFVRRLPHKLLKCFGLKLVRLTNDVDPSLVPIPLKQEHLQNCQVLVDRYATLDKIPQGGTAAELGVFEGRFSKIILEKLKPSKLYLMDIFTEKFRDQGYFDGRIPIDYMKDKFADEIEKGIVELKKGYSFDLLAELPDQSLDYIYIDADHKYQGVRKDLETAVKKLKPGGYIGVNDYVFYDPIKHYPYGVIQAVHEICNEFDFEIVYFALQEIMFCDVVLRQRQRSGI